MGYEVHIHRADHWLESDSSPISLDEWSAYVEQADDLRMDDFAESTTPDGATIRVDEPGIAVWTAQPDPAQGGWITFHEDQIVVNNPDAPMLRRMHEIALALGAQVQGDDGELYDAEGNPSVEERPSGGLLRRLFGRN
jgi:hypothetical protein